MDFSWRTRKRRPARPALHAWVVTTACTVIVGGGLAALAGDAGAAEGAIEQNAVTAHGTAVDAGPHEGMHLRRGLVGMAARHAGGGYWLVAADGGIFAFGGAPFLGSTGGIRLNQPVVGMAATPTGNGYWLAAADGGIFAFGDARFLGSTGGIRLNQPVVGMAATPTGNGYWLAAVDGGIFAFGDARFAGSMGNKRLPAPIVGVAASRTGNGYWLAGRDGQVYAQGVADHGNAAETEQLVRPPVVAIAAAPDGGGYWLVHGEQLEVGYSDRGAHVERIQRRLDRLGYWLGAVDGAYGALTRQAVYAFQKYEGLPVTGSVDRPTAARLSSASRPRARSTTGNLIEVDKARQLLSVVRDGRAVYVFNTSTGTEEPYTYEGRTYMADTPNGRWRISRSVDGYRQSNLGRLYRPRYFHHDGIAVHGYSFVPPYPDSHGCVRLTEAAMDFVWAHDLAPLGGEVWVYGTTPRS